jgi:predicted dehydrogenase
LRGYRLLKEAGFDDFVITALTSRDPNDAMGYVDRNGPSRQRLAVSDLAGDPLAIGDEYLSDFQDPARAAIFANFRELCAAPTVDAVMDLTPHGMHHLVARSAFAHGKHLLAQKPLAATMRAGRSMIEQAIESRVVLGTFECFRFMPLTVALDWLFRSGRGGELQMMLYGYVGSWWAPDKIVAKTPWRHQKEQGGGITLDLGVHFFDQMRLLAGRPKTITGRVRTIESHRHDGTRTIVCDSDDTVWASIDFERGASAQLLASWAGHGGSATMGSGSVLYGSKGKVDGEEVTFDDGTRGNLLQLYQSAPDVQPILPGVNDWFALGQHDWLRAILDGVEPISSGEEGLMNLAASLAILESSLAGRTVDFDEVWEGRLHAYQDPIDRALGFIDKSGR